MLGYLSKRVVSKSSLKKILKTSIVKMSITKRFLVTKISGSCIVGGGLPTK